MSGERIPNHKEKADTSNDSSPQTKWDDLSSVAFAKDIKNQHETSIEEIHQNVENPLTTDNLKTIMSLYSESSNSSIYHCLEKANAENKNYTKNTEDEKSFRESLYADWLESLRKIPKEEIQKSGKAFYVMGEYALSHPEVKNPTTTNRINRFKSKL